MTFTTIKSELKAFANKKVDYMRSYIELQEKLKKEVAEGMKGSKQAQIELADLKSEGEAYSQKTYDKIMSDIEQERTKQLEELKSEKNSVTADDVAELMEAIEYYRRGRDVYVVGVTNVGKSTLINAIIKSASGSEDVITTSRFPGTTLDKIEIPLDEDSALIDTPGIIHRGQMAHYLEPEDLKYVSPRKEIKPKTYQLNPEQTLFFGGLARFDFISGERQGMTAYFDNEINVHRTKLEGATEFYEKHKGEILAPALVGAKLVRREFKITDKSDIVFSGLGWVRVPQKAVVAAWVPEGVDVVVRKALIG